MDERSRLRYRMAVRSLAAFPEIGSRVVFAELYPVRVDAGIDFQRVDAAGGASARGVELDVAGADGILLYPAGREHRE